MRIIKNIFENESIRLYAERDHAQLIDKSNAIIHHHLYMPQGTGKWRLFKSIFYELGLWIHIRIIRPDYVFCLFATPSMILFAKILLKKTILVFFFHSILEMLYKQFSFIHYYYWMVPALKYKHKNCINIVLGETIQKELKTLLPGVGFEVIDHPYPMPETIKTSAPSGKIKLGSIGFGSREKGTDLFFVLEQRLREYTNELEFHYIGRISDSAIIPQGTNVRIHGGDHSLPPDDFNQVIDALDYCVFCYPPGSYRLTASGAIFDALTHIKPVIALKNSYFEYVFSKMGDIGYLCNTIDEMADIIKGMVKNRDDALLAKQRNITNGLKLFSVEHVEKQLREIIGRCHK